MKKAARFVRRLLDVALIGLVVFVLGLVLAINLGPGDGPSAGRDPGRSMEPAVHLGSVIDSLEGQGGGSEARATSSLSRKPTTSSSLTASPASSICPTVSTSRPRVTPTPRWTRCSSLLPRSPAGSARRCRASAMSIYLLTLPLGMLAVTVSGPVHALRHLAARGVRSGWRSRGATEPYESDLARLLDAQRGAQRMHELIG
jgi:hypothetical protein